MSLRVCLYSHNGLGLGHVRRNLKLVQALLRQRPNADVLLLTGSAALHEFPVPPGVDYIKLPSVKLQSVGRWRPHSLDMEMERLVALRRSIILEAIRTYRPHLFVADFVPLGVCGELRPALEELDARPDARTAIGFRDILDEPKVVRAEWKTDGTAEALETLYDLVLVYGEPDWYDFRAYGLDPALPRYVGLVGDPRPLVRHRSNGSVRLLASCGGGADGLPVVAATLEAAARVAHAVDRAVSCTAVTGPLMPEGDFERVRTIGRRVGAHVHRFAGDLAGMLARSDVVVGMAGYNTVCDVLTHRRPAVLVPRGWPRREQTIRAEILAERGLATILPLAECVPEALEQALLPLLEPRDYPDGALPRLDGAERAVRALLELLE
jgi:predicted glycosyltransferase